jgi:uncharacterized membrane protein (UPF0127 family)
VTESAWERIRGLLGRDHLPEGEAMWFSPCTSVHTFFMRFAIDVVFLDRRGRVLAFYPSLPPWRHTWIHLRAWSVVEAPAGALAGLRIGEELELWLSS